VYYFGSAQYCTLDYQGTILDQVNSQYNGPTLTRAATRACRSYYKILGLTFDPKLNYKKHIEVTEEKANKTINVIKALSGKQKKLS